MTAQTPPWAAEPWPLFRDAAPAEPDWLVAELLPAGALAFVAGPPKAGKTWVGLALAVSVASGRPLFGAYAVPKPRPALYVSLEGARSALRARVGALARGLGLDPDEDEALARLAFLYRPRPFDLADPGRAALLREAALRLGAALVVVDVLRAAARFRENVAEDFALIRQGLEPLLEAGCAITLLHHFSKLTEVSRDRSPGERMAGTGAMYGSLDVGFLITRSEDGARRLRVEVEARDFASPGALDVVLDGDGTGEHGGFRYGDRAVLALDAAAAEGRDLAAAAEGRDLAAELEQLFADGQWRVTKDLALRLRVRRETVRATLRGHPDRFHRLEDGRLVGRSKSAEPWGTAAMFRRLDRPDEEVVPPQGPPGTTGTTSPVRGDQPGEVVPVVPPFGGETTRSTSPRELVSAGPRAGSTLFTSHPECPPPAAVAGQAAEALTRAAALAAPLDEGFAGRLLDAAARVDRVGRALDGRGDGR